jgi:hypothetical protein
MRLGTARFLTGAFFVLMLVFVTWPGMLPFARYEPMILGLPFAFVWIALWIVASVFVLLGVDRVEARHRGDSGTGAGSRDGTGDAPPGKGSR